MSHFLLDCPNFRGHLDSLWANLTVKMTKFNDIDGRLISGPIANLDRHQKALFMITRFIAAAVTKIYKLRTERLHELKAPWPVFCDVLEFVTF